jgi:hypothetical protein
MKEFCIVISLLVIFIILGILGTGIFVQNPQPHANRQILQVPLSLADIDENKSPSIEANKLPEFVYDLVDRKFDFLINKADDVKDFVKATIVHSSYANEKINSTVSVDPDKRKMIVRPEDLINFTPGMYKLSLTLRTLEGDVDIEQDFSWGVIAVNTNKSIYRPEETAKIGIGVLDNGGHTLCMAGLDKVDDLSMTITDPQGNQTAFSIKDKTILDSGQCGPSTVTSDADFQATYKTTVVGIYQITVTATVNNTQRQIKDYFKVDKNVVFDVERSSFPTRIYPPAPYPVTFTVTSATDYRGTIEDIVPSFFTIEHLSGNGNLKNDKNFTHIIWNVDLKAGVSKNFTYFIKFPKISPEFYLVGPIKIGNFQEERQWQIASDAINGSTGVFTAEDNSTPNTWYRNWTGNAWSPAPPSAASSMSTTPADSRWFREASSPTTGEKLVAVWDNNNDGNRILYIYRWSGSAPWTLDRTVDPSTNWPDSNTRRVDIAYEQVSGEALLVYYSPDNANRITYVKRTSSGWGTATVAGTSTSPKAWIRLATQANSNNILLGYVNTSNYVGAMIWDGTADSFGREIVDNTGTTASGYAEETFGIAWESQTKIPMIMWANGSSSITYRRYTGSWTVESTTGLTGYAANVDWVNAAADDSPTSNNIALGTMNTGATTPNCDFAVWDGANWTKGSYIQCQSNRDRGINVAWEHGSGRAVWVYVTSAAPRQLSYSTWTSGTGFVAAGAMAGTTTNNIQTVELYSDFNTKLIICMFTTVVTGSNVGVYDREWDGDTSTWSAMPASGNSLFANINTDAENAQAFGFGFDMNLENLVAYRWFNNANSLAVGSPLTTQDTAYVLQTVNPDFRLRLLLYVSDTLAINGRYFKLQFVDPGTGTCDSPVGGTPSGWTDVGTGSATLIAYKDNLGGGVTDGANLTVDATNDPTYGGASSIIPETYEEQNDFINSRSAVTAGQAGMWDFSLHDNTTYDLDAQAFCFRVVRNSGALIKTSIYPMIITASLSDVIIQGNAYIRQGTTLR